MLKSYLEKRKKKKYLSTRVKIFCVGQNKTGTTSLQMAFEQLGFIVGNQNEAELLWKDYWNNNFDPIIEYCRKAEVFQDFPFSFPNSYKYLDKAFPKSKFILTVRDSPEQWFNSILSFHSKLFGNGKTPTSQDLKNANYVCKGWMWENMSKLYKINEDENPYDEEKLKAQYLNYNNETINYFVNRKQDLLILNLSEKDAYKKFCDFIGVKSDKTDFPWENKTSEIKL